MDEIRSWWEVPCIAHFCHIFSKPFKLVKFEIEELEDTLLLDEVKENPTPSLLVNLYCALLNGIVDKEVTEENWEFFLKMHIQWRNDNLNEKWNPHKDKIYKDLDTRTKVEILHRLIHWRLELDDIGDLLRGIDGLSLRVDPIGKDEDGNIYWYFYGTRLYLETPKKKPPPTSRKNKQDQVSGKGRGKGKGATPKTKSSQEDEEDKDKNEDEGGVWKMSCSTIEDWEELVEELSNCRRGDGRKLYNYINNELLPDVLYLLQQKEKIFKKKLLAEMPRRTSDRLAQKAVLREEEIMEALIREQQREEQRKIEAEELAKREEEAEKRHNEKMEEVIRKRKAKEEQQTKQRQEEEKNWTLAMSGELSGPRQAALGAVQGVVETQHLIDVDDKDEVLHTAMYKVMCGLRRHEDSWVFEEPVSEDIAPGYFDIVKKPMDFQTVEKKIEAGQYIKEKFMEDIELIFSNCKIYNGEDSEYGELAEEMTQSFRKLMTEHFVEDVTNKDEEEVNKKGKKKHSPSPELTSESSEESEEEEEDLEDEDEDMPNKKNSRKMFKNMKPLKEGGMMIRPNMVMAQQMYPPSHRHMMQQGMRPLPPEMMGYPPRYPYGQAPPYPPHPMHMRPPPREMFYPPPPHDGSYPRYPYPMNGPPPPYRPAMYPSPDHHMGHPHPMMSRPMGMPPGPHPPMANGPINKGPPPPQQEMGGDRLPRQRVSSPRVSSTVQTPPTSGDEKVEDAENKPDGLGVAAAGKTNDTVSNESEQETNQQQQKDQSMRHHPRLPNQPHPQYSQYPPTHNQPHPHLHHNQPHPYQQGWHHPPPPHMMNDQHYQAAMIAHQRRQMAAAAAHGYPPPSEHMWNGGQRPPYPYGGPTPQQMVMMERQRQYYEYQMKMRMRGMSHPQQQAPPTAGPPPPTNSSRPSSSGGESNHKPTNEDIPDYYNSLTNYAMGLASKENEEKESRSSSTPAAAASTGNEEDKQSNSSKENKTDNLEESQETPAADKKTINDDASNPSKQLSATPPAAATKPHPQQPPPPHHQWHHLSQYPMAPNGYGNQMMPYHPGMAPPPHMYGGPHLPRMPYPHMPPDPAMYGNSPGGRGGYTPQEMEKWQYMEMQRQQQWMMHHNQYQQQLRNSTHTPPTNKRPLSREGPTTESHNMEDVPPQKQMKVSAEQINGTAVAKDTS